MMDILAIKVNANIRKAEKFEGTILNILLLQDCDGCLTTDISHSYSLVGGNIVVQIAAIDHSAAEISGVKNLPNFILSHTGMSVSYITDECRVQIIQTPEEKRLQLELQQNSNSN